MEWIHHPDPAMDSLIDWYVQSEGWKAEQRDAFQTLACPRCGFTEYFHLMSDPQVSAKVRRERIDTHDCQGENIA